MTISSQYALALPGPLDPSLAGAAGPPNVGLRALASHVHTTAKLHVLHTHHINQHTHPEGDTSKNHHTHHTHTNDPQHHATPKIPPFAAQYEPFLNLFGQKSPFYPRDLKIDLLEASRRTLNRSI
jgi:hypothetical protein